MLVPRVRLYRRGMAIPGQYKQAVIPHVMIDGAAEGIAFCIAAFDASEHLRLDGDDGRIRHPEIGSHGSTLMLSDPGAPFAPPGADGASVALHVYVPDVSALNAQAVAAGDGLLSAPAGMVYGARQAMLRDPFGDVWIFLTPIGGASDGQGGDGPGQRLQRVCVLPPELQNRVFSGATPRIRS
jgi:PhnB protein